MQARSIVKVLQREFRSDGKGIERIPRIKPKSAAGFIEKYPGITYVGTSTWREALFGRAGLLWREHQSERDGCVFHF